MDMPPSFFTFCLLIRQWKKWKYKRKNVCGNIKFLWFDFRVVEIENVVAKQNQT